MINRNGNLLSEEPYLSGTNLTDILNALTDPKSSIGIPINYKMDRSDLIVIGGSLTLIALGLFYNAYASSQKRKS